MIKKINIMLFLIFVSFSVNAQQTVKEGKVSYATTELVYVDFENTEGISVGDTLFNKIKNKYSPVLKVKYLSKSSLSGENLTTKNIETGTSIFAFVIVQDSPEPDACPQFWDGEKWVRELRAARLYAHKKSVRGDLKKVRGEA